MNPKIIHCWQGRTRDFNRLFALKPLNSFQSNIFRLQTRSEAEVSNGVYESADNVYEDIGAAAKKKGKTDGGKKRKGPPKS